MELAPIILFVYNRPWHTKQTLESLAQNDLAGKSILYIFSDGPKKDATEKQFQDIQKVRGIIREKKWCGEVHIKESAKNKGLANSIIEGVTEIVNEYGKVIVLEDDLEVGKGFLPYMNRSLNLYINEDDVFQISGFLYPIKKISKKLTPFFVPLISTWGWATWKRAWDKIDFNPKDWHLLETDKKLSHEFNLEGVYDYTNMLTKQMTDRNYESWGIRFWWSVFRQKGLVLYPDYSLIQHLDLTNTGTHNGDYSYFNYLIFDKQYFIEDFPNEIINDKSKFNLIKNFLRNKRKISILKRVFKTGKRQSSLIARNLYKILKNNIIKSYTKLNSEVLTI